MNFYKHNNFNWDGIEKIGYKDSKSDGAVTFNATDRHTLVGDGHDTKFHLRYFECDIGGYSSLEKHQHVHVVIAARGQGKVIVEDKVYEVQPMDLVIIPSWAKHQLVNTSDEEPFGFFCIVDSERDRFQALTREEVSEMQKSDEVSQSLKLNEKYWG